MTVTLRTSLTVPEPNQNSLPTPALTVSEFARLHLNFHPDPKQTEVLDSPASRGILNCTRQWGKSTVGAIKAVHLAFIRPRTLILIASPGERQSVLLLRTARDFVRQLGITPVSDGDNPLSIQLPNGSRIIALPGIASRIRGFAAVNFLLIDEAAQVPDELYKTLQPCLAVSNGGLWLMSTPAGKQGFFYNAFTQGPAHWHRVSVPATECHRITPEFLADQRASLGQEWFNQEYMCQFIGTASKWFDPDTVDRAVTNRPAILKP